MLKLCVVPEVTEMNPLVVSAKGAARALRISLDRFRELVKKGEIKARVRGDGGNLLYLVSDLEEYARSWKEYKPGEPTAPRHLREVRR